MAELTLLDLATALRAYAGYSAIDVFADDVRELVQLRDTRTIPPGMMPLDATGARFAVTLNDAAYRLTVDRQRGIARLSRAEGAEPGAPVDAAALGGIAGAAAGAAIGAASTKKGEGWLPGLVLGLLAGAMLGQANAGANRPRRVFTLAFNPDAARWEAYDGGLVPWMKEELLPFAG